MRSTTAFSLRPPANQATIRARARKFGQQAGECAGSAITAVAESGSGVQEGILPSVAKEGLLEAGGTRRRSARLAIRTRKA